MNHTLRFFEDDPTGELELGARGYKPGRDAVLKMRENVRKAAQYLGPWCPDCGKKGTKCRNRETCRRRAITSVKTAKFVTLGYWGGKATKMDVQAKAYAECVKRGDVVREAVAA